MTVVRRVRADEWRELRAVRLAALLDSPDAFFRTHAEESAYDDAYWIERTRSLSGSDESAVFLAWEGAAPVGMTGGWLSTPDRVTVWGVWVAPQHRGSTIASELAAAVEHWAASDTAATELALDVVDGNDRAAAFYRRLGFQPNGVHKRLRPGADLMERELVKLLGR